MWVHFKEYYIFNFLYNNNNNNSNATEKMPES